MEIFSYVDNLIYLSKLLSLLLIILELFCIFSERKNLSQSINNILYYLCLLLLRSSLQITLYKYASICDYSFICINTLSRVDSLAGIRLHTLYIGS